MHITSSKFSTTPELSLFDKSIFMALCVYCGEIAKPVSATSLHKIICGWSNKKDAPSLAEVDEAMDTLLSAKVHVDVTTTSTDTGKKNVIRRTESLVKGSTIRSTVCENEETIIYYVEGISKMARDFVVLP